MHEELDKVFRTLLSEVYREVLKPKGWKRSGQNYRLIVKNGLVSYGSIVNFQKSQWNSGDQLRFTINCARKIVVGGEIDPNFKEFDCHFSDRHRPQGLCRKYHEDQWWCLTPETEYGALKAEIIEFLEAYALPWLMIATAARKPDAEA